MKLVKKISAAICAVAMATTAVTSTITASAVPSRYTQYDWYAVYGNRFEGYNNTSDVHTIIYSDKWSKKRVLPNDLESFTCETITNGSLKVAYDAYNQNYYICKLDSGTLGDVNFDGIVDDKDAKIILDLSVMYRINLDPLKQVYKTENGKEIKYSIPQLQRACITSLGGYNSYHLPLTSLDAQIVLKYDQYCRDYNKNRKIYQLGDYIYDHYTDAIRYEAVWGYKKVYDWKEPRFPYEHALYVCINTQFLF